MTARYRVREWSARTALILAAGLAASVSAQAPRPFEIVSLRRGEYKCPAFALDATPCPPPRPTWTMLPGGRLELTDHLAIDLIRVAYGVERLEPKYITGGPGWLWDERYDLIALVGTDAPVGAPVATGVDPALRARLRVLLQDRFKLRTATRKKRMDVLVLTRPRVVSASVLTSSPSEECEPSGPVTMPGVELMTAPCAVRMRPNGFDTRGMTMTTLADVLTPNLGLPVLDETGERGRFDFSVSWPSRRQPNGTFALKEVNESFKGLGLELRKASRPFDTLVIEGVERPDQDE